MNDADFSETTSSTASRLIWLDVDLLPESLKGSKSKLVRKAQIHLLLSYMQQEMEMESEMLTPMSKLRLLIIDELLDGQLYQRQDNGDIQWRKARDDVLAYFTGGLDGMSMVSDRFNYDECLDLIKLVDPESDTNFWPIILAIFAQKANRKSFYSGRRVGPTLSDIQLILAKLGDREKMV